MGTEGTKDDAFLVRRHGSVYLRDGCNLWRVPEGDLTLLFIVVFCFFLASCFLEAIAGFFSGSIALCALLLLLLFLADRAS